MHAKVENDPEDDFPLELEFNLEMTLTGTMHVVGWSMVRCVVVVCWAHRLTSTTIHACMQMMHACMHVLALACPACPSARPRPCIDDPRAGY